MKLQQASGDGGFVTRRLGGETIVIPVSSRVGDLDAIYTFNDTGARVWELIQTPTTLDDIVEVLCAEYDAEPEQIRGDVLDLLTELEMNGLVRIGNESAS